MRHLLLLTFLVGCNTHQSRFKPTVKPPTWHDEPKMLFKVPEMELSNDSYHVYVDAERHNKAVTAIIQKAGKILVTDAIAIDYVNIKNHAEWNGSTPIDTIELYFPIAVDGQWYNKIVLHKLTVSQAEHKPELWMFINPKDTTTERMFLDAGEMPFNIIYSTDPVSQENTGLPLSLKGHPGPIAYWGTSDYPDKSEQKHFSAVFKTPADLIWQFHKTRHPDYKQHNSVKYTGREIRFGWPWYEHGHRTTVEHLINVHGYTRESLQPYLHNNHLLSRIHGYAHTGQGTITP